MRARLPLVVLVASASVAAALLPAGAPAATSQTLVAQNSKPKLVPAAQTDSATYFLTGQGKRKVRIRVTGTIQDVDIGVQIKSPSTCSLNLALIRRGLTYPLDSGCNGSRVDMGSGSGCEGGMTIFDTNAARTMSDGLNPYDGRFRPRGFVSISLQKSVRGTSLGDLKGEPLRGTWKLVVQNFGINTPATISCFQVRAKYSP